jgi:hypothetical protein
MPTVADQKAIAERLQTFRIVHYYSSENNTKTAEREILPLRVCSEE